MQKVRDYTLKMKKPTDRGHRHLTFYRSNFFKMPLFFYLTVYLPIRLNPRRGHQMGSGEPSAGVSIFFFLLVFVQC